MRRDNYVIFDDFVINTGATSSPWVTTSAELSARLGLYDSPIVQVVLDKCTVTNATLSVVQQHSADGVNWLDKNVLARPMADPRPTMAQPPA